MKKVFFIALAVAGMSLCVSCSKDDAKSDYERGKEAGKAMCDCQTNAVSNPDGALSCLELLPMTTNADFLRGFGDAMENCDIEINITD